jgi:hypothetical protein
MGEVASEPRRVRPNAAGLGRVVRSVAPTCQPRNLDGVERAEIPCKTNLSFVSTGRHIQVRIRIPKAAKVISVTLSHPIPTRSLELDHFSP